MQILCRGRLGNYTVAPLLERVVRDCLRTRKSPTIVYDPRGFLPEQLPPAHHDHDLLPVEKSILHVSRRYRIQNLLASAQVVAYYFPKLVDLHNYAAANAVRQKVYNWNTLNEKVCNAQGAMARSFSTIL